MGKIGGMDFDLARALAADQHGMKAIMPHPALMSNDPVSVYQPGASRQQARLSDHRARRHGQVYGGELAMDTVMNCVDLYANSVSAADYRLEKPDGTRLVRTKSKSDPEDYQEGPEDLYRLLDNPNPYMNYDELIELLIIDLILVGNAYWYKLGADSDGKPAAIYRCTPAGMHIIPGQLGPQRYEYQPPGVRAPIKMKLEEVIHFKLPNPHDAFYGLGIVQKGSRAMDLDVNVVDTMANYYANRGDTSMIVQSERRVPRDVFQKLRAQLRQRLSGPQNAGQVLVLEAGLKASTLSPSASDALFDAVSGMTQARIYRMFRASKLLFGDAESAGAAQIIPAARREFDNYVIKPFARKLARRVTEALAALWDVKFIIDYSYALSPEEQLKAVEVGAAIPGIKVRELRRAMLPLGLVDGESTGDEEIDEEVLNMPMEEMDENGAGGAADRPIGSEPGRPPKGENTTNFKRTRSPDGKAVIDRRGSRRPRKKTVSDPFARLELLEDALKIEGKAVVKQVEHVSVGRKLSTEQRPDDPSAASRARAINDTTRELQRELGDAVTALERAMLDHAEGKAFKPGDLRNRISKSAAWETFREAVAAALEKAAQRAASAAAIDTGREADIDYDEVAKRVVYRKDGVGGIVRTLKRRLLAKLANDLNDESTKIDAEKLIQAYLGEWRQGHAETVAMTEAVHAYNEAALEVYEATGATEVYVEDGEDYDEPCVEANGSVWTIDHARDHRLEHPRCRRAFLPLPEVT